MADFFYDNFIDPIMSRTGYNPVNTATYAIIALASVYVIYILLKKKGIEIDKKFVYSILPFVLLGSTIRVVTDSIDSGIFKGIGPIHQLVLDSHIYDYGVVTASPGIYLVTAAILFLSMIILRLLKKWELLPYVAIVLWAPHFLLLVPFMTYFLYAIPILILAAIPGYAAYKYFKSEMAGLIVGGQALDGAATFFTIEIFSQLTGRTYFEQHVVSSFIGDNFGYFGFYLLKVALATLISYVIITDKKAEEKEKWYIGLLVIIMGFAPGIRDVLRMVIGT